MASGGHRLRIGNAIAKLNAIVTPGTNADTASSATEQPAASAERRQLTVMFCDLVGSTALSAKLDLEDGGRQPKSPAQLRNATKSPSCFATWLANRALRSDDPEDAGSWCRRVRLPRQRPQLVVAQLRGDRRRGGLDEPLALLGRGRIRPPDHAGRRRSTGAAVSRLELAPFPQFFPLAGNGRC